MSFNPSTPGTVGLEWLVDQAPGTYVLGSASAGYGIVVPSRVTEQINSIGIYAQAISGSGVFAAELHARPLVANVPVIYDTFYAGTETGKDIASYMPAGGAAWVNEASGAATFAKVGPGTDDVAYLQNVNAFEVPAAHMFYAGAGAQMYGKRILSVEVHCRMISNMTGNPLFNGYLKLSGNYYPGNSFGAPINTGWVDLTLGTWVVNPKTGLSWTLADVNALVATGATDQFGFTAQWAYQAAVSLKVDGLYVRVKSQPEDRLAYASGTVTTAGWQTWNVKSVPNLMNSQTSWLVSGTTGWTAGANTTLSNQNDRPGGWSASVNALQLSSTAAGAVSATLTTGVPCIPTKIYSFEVAVKALSYPVTLSLQFLDVNGTVLSTINGGLTSNDGLWDVASGGIGTAPATAATMKLVLTGTATAGAQTVRAAGFIIGLDSSAVSNYAVLGLGSTEPPQGAVEKTTWYRYVSGASSVFVLRRVSGTGVMSIPTMGPGSSAVGMPHGYASARITLQDGAGAISVVGSQQTDTTGLIMTTAAAATSADSQPYVARQTAQVDTSNTVKSEITTPVATYALVRFVVAAAVDPPLAPLLVKVKKISDNSQVGGTATIQPTDLLQITTPGSSVASRTTPQVYVATLASTATTGAVQHYLEFSSTAASGSGWYVYILDDGGSGDSATFGGTTDALNDPLNGGRSTRRDGMATLQTVPATPAALASLAVNP